MQSSGSLVHEARQVTKHSTDYQWGWRAVGKCVNRLNRSVTQTHSTYTAHIFLVAALAWIFLKSLCSDSNLNSDNYISPGSQIPQVEVRKRCTRDLFTSSRRATALIGRHFWYTILQQSMTHLTDTAILLAYTSRFHWRFWGNWQEHIWECDIRCFGSPSHLSLGSDRLNVTVCRTCTVPLWDVQRTVGSWSYRKNILGWLALRSSSSPHLYSTVVFGLTFWG